MTRFFNFAKGCFQSTFKLKGNISSIPVHIDGTCIGMGDSPVQSLYILFHVVLMYLGPDSFY